MVVVRLLVKSGMWKTLKGVLRSTIDQLLMYINRYKIKPRVRRDRDR